VKEAISAPATPAPTSARPNHKVANPSASANAQHPKAATPISTAFTRRGPNRSSQMPSGSCIAAKARK
jgi:hypothetical protein